MQVLKFSAALLSIGLLMAAPASAQSAPAQRQPTQEGGSTYPEQCSQPYNANPAADPDCNQRTQSVSPTQADNTHR